MYDQPTAIKQTGELLRGGLPDNKQGLLTHLRTLESLRFTVTEQRVEWMQLLHEKRAQMLWPKEKDKTELDRKVYLDASVAVIERDYDFLCQIEELVRDRLVFGRELLSHLC